MGPWPPPGCSTWRRRPPPFPDWPPPGITAERGKQLGRYLDDEEALRKRLEPGEVAAFEAFERATERVQRTPSPLPGKVPDFKFRTNDGWWVTPEECRTIDLALRRAIAQRFGPVYEAFEADGGTREDALEFLQLWAGYNRMAAACGGYRVF